MASENLEYSIYIATKVHKQQHTLIKKPLLNNWDALYQF